MKIFFASLLILFTFYARGSDKPLDFWDEEIPLFGVAEQGQHIDSDLSARMEISYISKSYAPDHSTKKTGDFSIVYLPDKSLAQRMDEAGASRTARIEIAFRQSTELDEALETANQLLVEEFNKSSDANAWSLFHTPIYCRFYYMFSNRKGKFPGRMTPETEELLLKTLLTTNQLL